MRVLDTPHELSLQRRIRRAVHQQGVATTARQGSRYTTSWLREAAYDVRHHMWTLWPVALSRLTVTGPRERGRYYQATPVHDLQAALRHFQIPPEGRFVDFGCGKGRVLVVALEYGFPSVVGVEFAAELAVAARRTLSHYKQSAAGPQERRFDIWHGDAAQYVVRPEDQVFYLFNPFDDVVLKPVLANLAASLQEHPRDAWLIYANPAHRDLLDADPTWHEQGTPYWPGRYPYLCYRTC